MLELCVAFCASQHGERGGIRARSEWRGVRSERAKEGKSASTHLASLAYPSRHSGAGRNPFLSVYACETLSDERETGVWFPARVGMAMRADGGEDVTQARTHYP